MNVHEKWRQWYEAEAQLAGGATIEVAASSLPQRQGALLRALAALESGVRAQLEDEIDATPLSEVRAILKLALEHPANIDPSSVRSGLKRQAVANEPLPRLDLVRLLAASVRGEQTRLASTLSEASRSRPVLNAGLDVLQRRGLCYSTLVALERRSPRLCAYYCAALAASAEFCGPLRELVAKIVPSRSLPHGALDPERWPELTDLEPLRETQPKRQPAPRKDPLVEFLRAPTKNAWSSACSIRVENSRNAPLAEKQRTLGQLLVAIHQLTSGVRPVDAARVAAAALEILRQMPATGERSLLDHLLQQVLQRLRWFSERDRAAQLDWVLDVLDPLSIDVRRGLAKELLAIARPGATPVHVLQKLLTLHVTHRGALDRGTLQVVVTMARALSQGEIELALRDVNPVQRGLMSAAHNLGSDRQLRAFADVLESLLALDPASSPSARRTVTESAEYLLRKIVAETPRTPAATGGDRKRLSLALTKFTAAAVRGEVSASLSLHADISAGLGLVQMREGLNAYKAWLRALRDGSTQAPEQRFGAERFILAHFTDDGAGGDARLKDLGRWLREASPTLSVPFLLRWAARMAHDTRSADPQWQRWLTVISTWLAHRPDDEVGSHALALGRQDPTLGAQLLDWAEEHRSDEFERGPWCDLEELVLGHIGGGLDDGGPDSFLRALEALGHYFGPAEIEAEIERLRGSFGGGRKPSAKWNKKDQR